MKTKMGEKKPSKISLKGSRHSLFYKKTKLSKSNKQTISLFSTRYEILPFALHTLQWKHLQSAIILCGNIVFILCKNCI